MANDPDPMRAMLLEISQRHFPNPPATAEQIEAFEQRVGWRLDPDLRAFYLHCDGADLFDRIDPPFRFHPLAQIVRARVAIRGKDTDDRGPSDWWSICAVKDGNCIILDVSAPRMGRYPLRDGYREMFPDPEYCPEIAPTFSAFLEGALRSNGDWFWLS
ncbi:MULTISPECIES: SMI1/KNR4 family protein [unclassified Corallococcus]|uniref:SMI1/KNR4 family protein n=1 Tax=unclassified Corallococcus TaxID=2685029 RepID=UPI001F5DEE24|nr:MULTISPECIES: SMI1/KNR4 family protein [unclassified Corallococcus]WAS87628.1 SMI1/KNR4 family protein [Corallococcus sp. NCRR]